ncbi:MAG: hypothetical protein ACKOTZ_11305 [Chloroflexota bacterium]
MQPVPRTSAALPARDRHASRRRRVAAVLAALLVTTAPGAVVAADRPVAVIVDDDGRAGPAGCDGGLPGSAATTIGAAVDDARPGTTIRVCPGTYPPVAIVRRPGIAIVATVPWRATILTAGGPGPVHAGIEVAGSDGTRISGLRILHRAYDPDRRLGRCRALSAGIHVHGSRAVVLRAVRVRAVGPGTLDPRCGMTFGIVAGTPGLLAPPAGAAVPSGAGAGAADPLATEVTVAWSLVADHLLGGIVAVSTVRTDGPRTRTGPTRALLLRDSVRFFHPAARACDGPARAPGAVRATGAMPDPVSAAGRLRAGFAALLPAGVACLQEAAGVYLGAGVADSPIPGASGRVVGVRVLSAGDGMGGTDRDPRGDAVQLAGIVLADPAHRAGATAVVRARVDGSLAGIVAVDAAGARIARSRATGGLVGIHVADTVGAALTGTVATANDAGIVLTDALLSVAGALPGDGLLRTADVMVLRNDARGNRTVACADETAGAGTAGTANTWTANRGGRGAVRPVGICAAR